jgi:hypothetical protein
MLIRTIHYFMLICAAILIALGVFTAVSKPKHGSYPLTLPISAIAGGMATLWANDVTQGRVTVTPDKIRTRNITRRAATKAEINSIDIVHWGIGKTAESVPNVTLKSGGSFVLRPLAWSDHLENSQPGWTERKQRDIVRSLREALGVGGVD